MIRHLILYVALMCANTFLTAQSTWVISNEQTPEINITGTSTLHEWKAAAGEISGYPLSIKVGETGATIESFDFDVVVQSLDGGRGAAMNTKIKNAFKYKEFPTITFKQTSPVSIPYATGDWSLDLEVKGNIAMAGFNMDEVITVQGKIEEGKLILSGSKPLKMSEYGIEPPSAMFGQIETDDDVVVHFSFTYEIGTD